jgi:hypothetical protein
MDCAMAAVGLRVKTGKALAIAIAGAAASPRPILREEVALADPAVMDTVHPYHLEIEGQPEAAEAAARRARRIGAAALARLFESVSAVERIESITIVVNTHTPPERITSPHMRAHGKEGWLFREICEQAAESLGIEPSTLALDEIPLDGRSTQRALTTLGVEFGRPWTADWKLAAAAAFRTLR